jgi:hypothetical protein
MKSQLDDRKHLSSDSPKYFSWHQKEKTPSSLCLRRQRSNYCPKKTEKNSTQDLAPLLEKFGDWTCLVKFSYNHKFFIL